MSACDLKSYMCRFDFVGTVVQPHFTILLMTTVRAKDMHE